MFKHYLKGIDGITSYPMVTLIVFFLFFAIVTIAIARTNKKQLDYLSKLPFSDGEKLNN
jgi:cbb3-type cytochrome oxidase subunit 3